MNSLKEELERNQNELIHLQEEMKNLRNAENDMPRESFQRDYQRLVELISQIEDEISSIQRQIASYDAAKKDIMDLRRLRDTLDKEEDGNAKDEIAEEISSKEDEIRNFMANLTPNTQDELRNEIISENEKQPEYNEDRPVSEEEVMNPEIDDNEVPDLSDINNEEVSSDVLDSPSDLEDELSKVNEQLQQSINNFLNIFDEERKLVDQGTINAFNQEYMDKKIEENKIFEKLKKRKEELEARLKDAENIEIKDPTQNSHPLLLEEKPRPLSITTDQNNNINNNSKLLGLPGPVLGETKGISGPTMDEQQPTKNETLGLPGPVLGETKGLPGPTKKKDTKPPKQKTSPPPKPKRGVKRIIDDLTQGLEVKKKDNKKYKASNINIHKNFKTELQSGNYLYNIVHTAGTVMKVPFQLLSKLKNKLTYRKEDKKRINTLKERINNLSEEDLMTLYNEYRGNTVIAERFPTILNTLLEEKMNSFIMEKVTAINTNLEENYKKVFTDYAQIEAIEEKLRNENLSKEQKDSLLKQKETLLKGKAKQIESIRKDYVQANNYLSGGLHGFSEDMKAAATKLSCVGKRFTKDYDLDQELLAKEAHYEDEENKAIRTGNDEKALENFIKGESLLSENTEIKESVFGTRSVGKKYYSPLAEMLDYRDDPFIRDVFTTVAVASAAISTVNALTTQRKLHETLQSEQQEAARVNNINNRQMDQVHQTGSDIVAQNDNFTNGLKAQMNQAVTDASGVIERKNLDLVDWHIGTDKYHQLDAAGHNAYEAMYNSTKASIADITTKYGSGSISQADALSQFVNLANAQQAKLVGIYNEYIPILSSYAKAHPQFDLSGVLGAMKYISKHPDAISNMNNSMASVINSGESLIGLTAEQVKALDSLPSDLSTTILGTATSASLAYNVAKNMGKNRKTSYGNAVTDMVDEYVENTYGEEETNEKQRAA